MLLASTDDIWLKGYLSINSAVVRLHCADVAEAEHAAQLALSYSEESGHRATKRAANATLGHIQLSRGHLDAARKRFAISLECCEAGSLGALAILDSLAQVALAAGDLNACRNTLECIDRLELSRDHSKTKHYQQWALQTKIQLLLKEKKNDHAREIIKSIKLALDSGPQPRVTTATKVAAVETLIANGDTSGSVDILANMLAATAYIPPDLLADIERVTAATLQSSGAPELATLHLQRAIRIFEMIGHKVGHSLALSQELAFDNELGDTHCAASRKSLDRVRALFDMRTRPELFSSEVMAWLTELECAESCTISDSKVGGQHVIASAVDGGHATSRTIEIDLGSNGHRSFVLRFTPRQDSVSKVTASEFLRVVTHITDGHTSLPPLDDLDVLWLSSDDACGNAVVFAADSMLAILKSVRQIARTDLSVLLTGETGVGKEIIARRIHEHSARADKPFMALNCAAIPRELLESQLFGFRKGAFSGAVEPFQGVVRAANGGTLLLDEIAELPVDAQAKILRFLEEGEVHPIGEVHPTKVDVRILFATNSNLELAVRDGRFREDLFYRINVVPIQIPPLRQRRDEIPLLVRSFCERFAREFSKSPIRFSQSAMELLILYSWPGNLRQLSNEVRRITALTDSSILVTPELLSREIVEYNAKGPSPAGDTSPHIRIALTQPLARAVEQLEREMLRHALDGANGQVERAARTLGLSRKGLYLKRRRLRRDPQGIHVGGKS
jgi:DNA-binding NtrC family response regulator